MAYSRTNLGKSPIGSGGSNPNIYSFVDTASTKAAIATADYFLSANDILEQGDAILARGSDGVVWLHVTASTATTVTVAEVSLA